MSTHSLIFLAQRTKGKHCMPDRTLSMSSLQEEDIPEPAIEVAGQLERNSSAEELESPSFLASPWEAKGG